MTTPTERDLHSRHPWIPPALLIVVVAWEAIREAGPLSIGDVFWHLRTGDLVLSDGPPREDLFSWTAAGEQWRPNAWFGDAGWAIVRSAAGSAGVSLLTGVFVLAIALLLYRSSRRSGSGPWAAVASSALAVVFLAPFIAPRPLLIGFVLLPVLLDFVGRYRTGQARALVWVFVLAAVWSNLHGSFVVAVAITGLIAIGWALDDKTLAGPFRLALAATVAGLLNPYGVFSYLQALFNRAQSQSIDEWQPLDIGDGRGIVLVVFMVLTAFALWRTASGHTANGDSMSRSLRWETLLPLVVLAGATFWSVRMGSFFLLVAAPIVAAGLSGISAPQFTAWASERAIALIGGLAVAGVILAVQELPELAHAGDPAPRFSESVVAAIPTDCRLLNEYDLGGFIIDRRWPDVKVSQDGRADLFGAEELERQEGWLDGSDTSFTETMDIECVLADRDRPLAEALAADPEWELRAESNELVLLVKRNES